MNPGKSRSVYRYFDPADSFVQILVCDGSTLELPTPPGLNRQGYRRLVIQTCMPEFRGDLNDQLEQLFPEDPLLAEDLLYQLCTEVNPGLDIHTVRLRDQVSIEPIPETGSELALDAGEDDPEGDFLIRMRRRARGLARRLGRKVIGQDEAVRAVERAVHKAAAGLAEPNRPIASFLLVGRTGTGKTELARCLAKELFGDSKNPGIVRIDCSEYGLAHEYSKLIGAPPGYVGHEDGGQLTEALQRNPESLVLFDEVEKAHPRMHNLLLQILEEGELTDSKGRRVRFDRAIVVLTSNAGADEIVAASRCLGFERERALGHESLRDITHGALERQFTPEFLGRLDEITLFQDLDEECARRIARTQLTNLAARARSRGVRVCFTPAVAGWVSKRGYSPDFGARELRRVIRRELEAPLSQYLLEHDLHPDAMLRVRVRDDQPAFEPER